MSIRQQIELIKSRPNCILKPPSGSPVMGHQHILPADLQQFYEISGGAALYTNADYPITIVEPSRLVSANPVLVGEQFEDDISSSWYIIAEGLSDEFVTIDLAPERLGRCYDSFFDRHAVAGSCPIIALSFTELLERLVDDEGAYRYWLRPEFRGLGDAYE